MRVILAPERTEQIWARKNSKEMSPRQHLLYSLRLMTASAEGKWLNTHSLMTFLDFYFIAHRIAVYERSCWLYLNRIFIYCHNSSKCKDGTDFFLVPIGNEWEIAEDAECDNGDHFSP